MSATPFKASRGSLPKLLTMSNSRYPLRLFSTSRFLRSCSCSSPTPANTLASVQPSKFSAVSKSVKSLTTGSGVSASSETSSTKPRRRWARSHIAFGSNVGNTVEMIEKALKDMEDQSHGTVRVLRTSGLWRTKAMYVLDQPDFMNGVCEIDTCLPPQNLLSYLQGIEDSLGRVKLIDKGPRCIDLDILLYGDETVQTERLIIPHALMLEREFVLRPLSELIPDTKVPHPLARGTVQEHLSWLPASEPAPTAMFPLIKSISPFLPLDSSRETSIMSIFNATPDSFSTVTEVPFSESTIRTTLEALRPYTHILDIGGQSTRPGATPIDYKTEISRVAPVIEAATSSAVGLNFPAISVDTFSSDVAEAALSAGAHMINDISGGTIDPRILSVVAKHDASIVLMHTRGTPETMSLPAQTTYPSSRDGDSEIGLLDTIAKELRERIDAAEAAGIRRWKIMLDPGIGFAKTGEQNIVLLRRLQELREHPIIGGAFPWLVGTSRKGFVGKITGVKEPGERLWGTAGTIAAAVAGGADVVRVHDPKEMGEVAKMADAIWRKRGVV